MIEAPSSCQARVRTSRLRSTVMLLAMTLMVALPAVPASAQTADHWFDHSRVQTSIAARDSGAVMRLVRPLSEKVQGSVVQVFSGGRIVALGTVISEDGYILTKQSELSADPISIRVPNGQKVAARVSSVRKANDLALLKLEGEHPETWGIEPIHFATEGTANGSFLISAGRDGRTIGLGVLGVQPRPIQHRGILGVGFYDASDGPAVIRRVEPYSGADEAGLQNGDQILMIDGRRMIGSKSAIRTLGGKYPGDVVRLTILRGDDRLELAAQLSERAILMESQNDAKVNGPRNARLSGFDSVIQHDTVLTPNQCGGPVLDSDGDVIGINIARAGRVVSYALPSSLVTAEMISMLEEARRQ